MAAANQAYSPLFEGKPSFQSRSPKGNKPSPIINVRLATDDEGFDRASKYLMNWIENATETPTLLPTGGSSSDKDEKSQDSQSSRKRSKSPTNCIQQPTSRLPRRVTFSLEEDNPSRSRRHLPTRGRDEKSAEGEPRSKSPPVSRSLSPPRRPSTTALPQYCLGDEGRIEDMVVETNYVKAVRNVNSLKKHDFCFVLRSNGKWTYAITAYRSGSGDGVDSRICVVVDEEAKSKTFEMSQWAKFIRLVKRPNDQNS